MYENIKLEIMPILTILYVCEKPELDGNISWVGPLGHSHQLN